MRRAMAAGLGIVIVMACQGVESYDGAAGQPVRDDSSYGFSAARAYAPAGLTAAATPAAEVPVVHNAAFAWPTAASAMLIRTAQAVITVDSLEPALAAVKQMSERLGGLVGDARIDTGEKQRRVAVLELRIPSERFDEVLNGLEPVGEVVTINVNTQDVGEEYVDVTARTENARRLERRLLDILSARTARLRDVLEVEQALARVREEIERYEGRLRYLKAHVATSSITVTLQEPAPIVGHAGTSVLGEAVRQAWRNFVTLLAVTVSSLGVVLPLGAVAFAAWSVVRRRRAARPATA